MTAQCCIAAGLTQNEWTPWWRRIEISLGWKGNFGSNVERTMAPNTGLKGVARGELRVEDEAVPPCGIPRGCAECRSLELDFSPTAEIASMSSSARLCFSSPGLWYLQWMKANEQSTLCQHHLMHILTALAPSPINASREILEVKD